MNTSASPVLWGYNDRRIPAGCQPHFRLSRRPGLKGVGQKVIEKDTWYFSLPCQGTMHAHTVRGVDLGIESTHILPFTLNHTWMARNAYITKHHMGTCSLHCWRNDNKVCTSPAQILCFLSIFDLQLEAQLQTPNTQMIHFDWSHYRWQAWTNLIINDGKVYFSNKMLLSHHASNFLYKRGSLSFKYSFQNN